MNSIDRFRRSARAALLLCIGLMAAVGPARTAEPLDIAVIGGSGMIGQRIVREALERGHRVTLVVRDPARASALHERMSVMRGDVLEPAQIREIAVRHDVLVSAVGERP